jgi:hypothetical protein
MQHRLSSVLGRQTHRPSDGDKESITVAEWAPVVDIIEDETEYLIKVDLPEIKREEIKVTVGNGVLVLSGERKLEKEEKGRKYHRIERAYGSFGRASSSIRSRPQNSLPTSNVLRGRRRSSATSDTLPTSSAPAWDVSSSNFRPGLIIRPLG